MSQDPQDAVLRKLYDICLHYQIRRDIIIARKLAATFDHCRLTEPNKTRAVIFIFYTNPKTNSVMFNFCCLLTNDGILLDRYSFVFIACCIVIVKIFPDWNTSTYFVMSPNCCPLYRYRESKPHSSTIVL